MAPSHREWLAVAAVPAAKVPALGRRGVDAGEIGHRPIGRAWLASGPAIVPEIQR